MLNLALHHLLLDERAQLGERRGIREERGPIGVVVVVRPERERVEQPLAPVGALLVVELEPPDGGQRTLRARLQHAHRTRRRVLATARLAHLPHVWADEPHEIRRQRLQVR